MKGAKTVVGRRRPQWERSAETQRKLIESAIGLLVEYGFSRLTVSEVAARAGLTTGAVQHHFPSSRDLYKGILDAAFPIFRVDFRDIAIPEVSVAQRVDYLVDRYWQIYSRPEYLAVWELILATRADAETRLSLHKTQAGYVAHAIHELTRLFSDQDLPVSFIRHLLMFVTSELRGLALLIIFEGKTAEEDQLALVKEAAQSLIEGRATSRQTNSKKWRDLGMSVGGRQRLLKDSPGNGRSPQRRHR
jgi:AcrR family transcriptional regulator